MEKGDYIVSTNTEDGRRLVFIFNELCTSTPHQCCSTTYLVEETTDRFEKAKKHTTYKNEYRTYALANSEEKAWLDYCIAQDKYAKPEDVPAREFKKGDYIVLTKSIDTKDFKTGYVYKQVYNDTYLSVEKDCEGDRNSWSWITYESNRWRKATASEIRWYNYDNQPVGVVTQVTVGGLNYSIDHTSSGWFCSRTGDNEKIFIDNNINKTELQGNTLDYSNSDYFPHCNTHADLMRFVKAINNWIDREEPQVATAAEVILEDISPSTTLKDICAEVSHTVKDPPLITSTQKKSRIRIELDKEQEEDTTEFKVRKKKKLNF